MSLPASGTCSGARSGSSPRGRSARCRFSLVSLSTNGPRTSSGQSELARDLGLTSSALTALVDRLERHGVAERVQHPQDRRRTTIRVTERGTALVVQSHEWLDATLDRIAPADLELVSDSLAAIASDLSTRRSGGHANDTPSPSDVPQLEGGSRE